MSYIVAFISFEESHKEFPVQCFRTDIKRGDSVVVRRGDGKLKYANVQHLKYLNWECNGRIECKVDEITRNSDSEIVLPKGSPLSYGLSNAEVFVKELKAHGWILVKSKRRQYRAVLGFTNDSMVGYLFVRKNGIDIQVLSRVEKEIILPYSMHTRSFSEGTVAHHF